jgi:hypothetical protein
MGKGPDAARDLPGAIEDLKGDEVWPWHGREAGNSDQAETLGRSAILTSPSWLVNVSVRSALWACATPKIRRARDSRQDQGGTGLNASAGISYNKFLAKLASDHRKPNGQYVITPETGPAFVEPSPSADSTASDRRPAPR